MVPIYDRHDTYIRMLSFLAQFRYKRTCVIVEIVAADAVAIAGVGVIAPAEDTGVRDVGRQEITEPVDLVLSGPGPVTVAVKTIQATMLIEDISAWTIASQRREAEAKDRQQPDAIDLLDNRVFTFCHNLQAMREVVKIYGGGCCGL